MVRPCNGHVFEIENLSVSQRLGELARPCSMVVAQGLLIEFGLHYYFAASLDKHDPGSHLVSSTQALLLLLTGSHALPEHVEYVAPHDETLCDA